MSKQQTLVGIFLQLAAKYGELSLLEKLQNLGVDFKDVTPTDRFAALAMATQGGHLEVIRWLREKLEFTAADARARDNFVIRKAHDKGDVEIIDYLQSAFGIGLSD